MTIHFPSHVPARPPECQQSSEILSRLISVIQVRRGPKCAHVLFELHAHRASFDYRFRQYLFAPSPFAGDMARLDLWRNPMTDCAAPPPPPELTVTCRVQIAPAVSPRFLQMNVTRQQLTCIQDMITGQLTLHGRGYVAVLGRLDWQAKNNRRTPSVFP